MADTTNTTTVHTVEVVRYDDPVIITERVAVAAFLAGYTDPHPAQLRDRSADLRHLVPRPRRQPVERQATPPRDVRSMDGTTRPDAIDDRAAVVDAVVVLQVLPDRRHRRQESCRSTFAARRSTTNHELSGLDRNELGALLVQAGLGDLRDGALITLLALNGLRISEALNADIDDLSTERGHRTLAIVRKGGKHVTIPIAPRTGRALDLYIGERTMGPIFLGVEGGRMDRYCADRMVKRLVKRAGIDKRISPHSLRHSFITAALDAGVPLRDVQEAASHADPRTTMRYDRARRSLDRHATYIVSTFIAGATRPG